MGERARVDRAEVALHEDAEVRVGEAQHVRLVAHERAAVLRGAQPAVRADLVAERVRQRVTARQHAARVDQLLQRVAAHLVRVVVLVPLLQVAQRRV